MFYDASQVTQVTSKRIIKTSELKKKQKETLELLRGHVKFLMPDLHPLCKSVVIELPFWVVAKALGINESSLRRRFYGNSDLNYFLSHAGYKVQGRQTMIEGSSLWNVSLCDERSDLMRSPYADEEMYRNQFPEAYERPGAFRDLEIDAANGRTHESYKLREETGLLLLQVWEEERIRANQPFNVIDSCVSEDVHTELFNAVNSWSPLAFQKFFERIAPMLQLRLKYRKAWFKLLWGLKRKPEQLSRVAMVLERAMIDKRELGKPQCFTAYHRVKGVLV